MVMPQVVIALSGGELIYFELSIQGQLLEVDKKDLAGDVACLDVAPVPEGRQRSRFLAVASYDSTVTVPHRLLSSSLLLLQHCCSRGCSALTHVLFLEYMQAATSYSATQHPTASCLGALTIDTLCLESTTHTPALQQSPPMLYV